VSGTALALAVAASMVLLPPELWRTWLLEVRPSLGYGLQPVHLFSPACPSNQSLNAMVSRLFLAPTCEPIASALPLAGRWLAYCSSLVVVGSSLMAVLKAHAALSHVPCGADASCGRPADVTDAGFSLFLAAMFLTGSLSWEHHLVFALPGLALVTLAAVRRPRARLELTGLAFATLGILVTLPLAHPALRQGWAIGLISIRTLAVVVLWLLLRARIDVSVAADAENSCVYSRVYDM
jgi:hypothetical protein